MDDDPALVTSGLSQGLEEDGYVFEISIFRSKMKSGGRSRSSIGTARRTSHVWDDPFS